MSAAGHADRLYADPDRAIADHDAAMDARRVEVHHDEGAPGTSEVFMTLDTADAVAFDRTVSTMAATMRSLGHEVVLVFHVTDRDLLDDNHGVAHSPTLGPLLTGRLRSWLLCAGQVTVQPVVDLDATAHPPVDAHDPPARMAEMVRLHDETCVYPRCERPSRVDASLWRHHHERPTRASPETPTAPSPITAHVIGPQARSRPVRAASEPPSQPY